MDDILHFAMEEKRGKQEAVQVLAQLQENYDDVQRKLAEAENKIDLETYYCMRFVERNAEQRKAPSDI